MRREDARAGARRGQVAGESVQAIGIDDQRQGAVADQGRPARVGAEPRAERDAIFAGEGPGDALALLSIDLQCRSSATRWIALPIGVV
jgi:hypothetical protein